MKLKLIVGQFSHIRGSIGTKFNFSKKGENIMKAVSVILMVILFSAAAFFRTVCGITTEMR